MTWRWVMAVVLGVVSQAWGQGATATDGAKELGRGSRVLVVSIDGLRPDLALRASMPHMRELLEKGSFTFWARTTDVAITLPSHMSMMTGVVPKRHTITWNGDVPADVFHYSAVPTLFDLAKEHGYTTALVSGKSKFIAFDRPGSIDWCEVPPAKSSRRDDDVANRAAKLIDEHKPQVMMVHFGDVDGAGHRIGWGTPEQIDAIGKADAALGVVLDALQHAGVKDQTLIILSADHGGFGRSHGAGDQRALNIPWIAVGPGVRAGYDLNRLAKENVRTEDTFATACWFLSITPPEEIEGRPQTVIFDNGKPPVDAAPVKFTPKQENAEPTTKPTKKKAA